MLARQARCLVAAAADRQKPIRCEYYVRSLEQVWEWGSASRARMGKYETAGAKEWDRSRRLHKQVIKKRKQRQAESREAAESEPEAGPRVPYGATMISLKISNSLPEL